MHVEFEPLALLAVLTTHRVRFLVVGGFAAWMHGAPIVTADLDIIYDPRTDNLQRLIRALDELDASYRHQHGRIIRPTAESFADGPGEGHHLLQTRYGPLDVLRRASGQGYEELRESVVLFEIDGMRISFVGLARIIELKESAGRPKDIAALPTLRAAMEEERKKDGG